MSNCCDVRYICSMSVIRGEGVSNNCCPFVRKKSLVSGWDSNSLHKVLWKLCSGAQRVDFTPLCYWSKREIDNFAFYITQKIISIERRNVDDVQINFLSRFFPLLHISMTVLIKFSFFILTHSFFSYWENIPTHINIIITTAAVVIYYVLCVKDLMRNLPFYIITYPLTYLCFKELIQNAREREGESMTWDKLIKLLSFDIIREIFFGILLTLCLSSNKVY